jgi:hypothetical protein
MIQERLGEGDFVDSCLLQSLFVGDICQPNLPHAATRQFLLHTFLYIHSLNTQDFLLCPELGANLLWGFISGRCCGGIVTTAFRDWIRQFYMGEGLTFAT